MDNRINSKQNPKVKQLVKLRERKHRDTQEKFLIEGIREINAALDANVPICEYFICEDFIKSKEAKSLHLKISNSSIPIIELGPDVFEKCAYRENPDGIIAVSQKWEQSLDELTKEKQPIFLVLENIEKPGNLGAILRVSKGLGANAIICTENNIDFFNPNVIRASQGLVFSSNLISTNNEPLLTFLVENHFNISVTTPSAKETIWNSNLQAPLALVFGSENLGVSDFWLNANGIEKTKIPIKPNVDSLNLASAASIYLYEAVRNKN